MLACGLALLFALPAFSAETAKNAAYVLVNNAPLYEEGANRSLKYLEGITIGDPVVLTGASNRFKESGTEREFLRVKAPSGKEGWIRSQYIASNASLAVVKNEKATVFSEPRDVKITSRSISPLTLVGVLDDKPSAEWVAVQAWDSGQKILFRESTYLMRSSLSFVPADVQSAILLTVALDSPNATVKANLLGLALSKYPGSIFRDRIQELLNAPGAASGSAAAKAVLRSPTEAVLPRGTVVSASSHYQPPTATSYRYDISQAFDDDPKTAWAEGREGGGVGESISVSFAAPKTLDALEIMAGFFDSRYYLENVRIRSLRLVGTAENGSELVNQSFELADQMKPQTISLPKADYKKLVLTVESVYAEEKKDLPISELHFLLGGARVQP